MARVLRVTHYGAGHQTTLPRDGACPVAELASMSGMAWSWIRCALNMRIAGQSATGIQHSQVHTCRPQAGWPVLAWLVTGAVSSSSRLEGPTVCDITMDDRPLLIVIVPTLLAI
jgi:hypothetical protein